MTLLIKIHRYLHSTGMRPSTFGRRVARDPRLVMDMRLGRVPRLPLMARIEAFIEGEF